MVELKADGIPCDKCGMEVPVQFQCQKCRGFFCNRCAHKRDNHCPAKCKDPSYYSYSLKVGDDGSWHEGPFYPWLEFEAVKKLSCE